MEDGQDSQAEPIDSEKSNLFSSDHLFDSRLNFAEHSSPATPAREVNTDDDGAGALGVSLHGDGSEYTIAHLELTLSIFLLV